MKFDAVVLGSGTAARQAAMEASRRGLEVLLLPEAVSLPQTAYASILPLPMLRDSMQAALRWRRMLAGQNADPRFRSFPLGRMRRRGREMQARQRTRLDAQLQKVGVRIDSSQGARFVSPNRIRVGSGDIHEAPIAVVGTGSCPRRPERFAFDDHIICDSASILSAERAPRSLLIVGAEGAGCELACLFAALGSNVTIVDRRRRALRYVDRELVELLHAGMQEMGIELVLGEWLEEISVERGSRDPYASVRLASGRVEKCDCVVVAAGHQPLIEGLGLLEVGIEVDSAGQIVVDEYGRTTQRGVYAVGEVISNLATIGEAHQGRTAILDALGLAPEVPQAQPMSILTIPEISLVGLPEEVCQRLDIPHIAVTVRLDELQSAELRDDQPGMLKLVVGRDAKELLGVQIVGPEARDLVQLGASLIRRGGTVGDLVSGVFSAPSSSEVYWEAALRVVAALEQDPTPIRLEPSTRRSADGRGLDAF